MVVGILDAAPGDDGNDEEGLAFHERLVERDWGVPSDEKMCIGSETQDRKEVHPRGAFGKLDGLPFTRGNALGDDPHREAPDPHGP